MKVSFLKSLSKLILSKNGYIQAARCRFLSEGNYPVGRGHVTVTRTNTAYRSRLSSPHTQDRLMSPSFHRLHPSVSTLNSISDPCIDAKSSRHPLHQTNGEEALLAKDTVTLRAELARDTVMVGLQA